MASISQGAKRDSHTVARNSIILLGRYFGIWAANALLVLFLPRYLGAQGLGQVQFSISFVSLFAVGVGLGVKPYLIKEIARDRSQVHAYLGSSIGLRLLLAIAVLAIIVGYTEVSGYSQTARWVMYLAAAYMVITSMAQLMSTFLFGMESMGRASFPEIASKVFVAAAGIAVLVAGAGVIGYAVVLVGGSLVQFGVGAGYVGRLTRFRVDFDKTRMKTLIVAGMPYLLLGFVLNIYTNTDAVMLRFLANEEVVGWHAAALQIFKALQFLPVVLTTALLPTLSRMYKEQAEQTSLVASRSIGVVLLVMMPVGVGLALVSGELIRFLPYPPSFSHTVPILALMGVTLPVTAVLTLLGTIAAAVDRQNRWAVAMCGTALLNIVLNVAAIPMFQHTYGNGGIGAAAVSLVSECVMVIVGIWLVPKGLFNRHLFAIAWKVAVSTGGMALAVLASKGHGLDLGEFIGIGVVAYGALVLMTRTVNAQDLAFLRSTLGKRMGSAQQPATEGEESL